MSIEGQNSPSERESAKKPSSPRVSIISLVAGAVSLAFFPAFFGGLGLITGLVAIFVYFGEKRSGAVSTFAPLVMGAIGLGLSIVSVAAYFIST
jgi:hypothetical protein